MVTPEDGQVGLCAGAVLLTRKQLIAHDSGHNDFGVCQRSSFLMREVHEECVGSCGFAMGTEAIDVIHAARDQRM